MYFQPFPAQLRKGGKKYDVVVPDDMKPGEMLEIAVEKDRGRLSFRYAEVSADNASFPGIGQAIGQPDPAYESDHAEHHAEHHAELVQQLARFWPRQSFRLKGLGFDLRNRA